MLNKYDCPYQSIYWVHSKSQELATHIMWLSINLPLQRPYIDLCGLLTMVDILYLIDAHWPVIFGPVSPSAWEPYHDLIYYRLVMLWYKLIHYNAASNEGQYIHIKQRRTAERAHLWFMYINPLPSPFLAKHTTVARLGLPGQLLSYQHTNSPCSRKKDFWVIYPGVMNALFMTRVVQIT